MNVYIKTTKTSNRGWCFGGLGAEKYKTSSNRSCAKKRIHHHTKITTMQHDDDDLIEYLVGGVDIAKEEDDNDVDSLLTTSEDDDEDMESDDLFDSDDNDLDSDDDDTMDSGNDQEVDEDSFIKHLLGDDTDDDNDADFLLLTIIASVVQQRQRQELLQHRRQQKARMLSTTEEPSKTRKSFYVRNRLEWDNHVRELTKEGPIAFCRLYRMQHSSFVKLCHIIRPFVRVNEEMSRRRSNGKGSITVEIMLHCTLRWLGGGSYLDIRLSAGISIPSFFRCVHACINAIVLCESLTFSFPTTEADLQAAADGFKSISSNGVIDGCIACVDGILLKIQTPREAEVGNVKAFFSGHYQTYGINVQAACDSNCKFVSVCTAAPGGSNDIAAFRKTLLAGIVANGLPVGKYIVGDNAYTCGEHLLTPFSGKWCNALSFHFVFTHTHYSFNR